MPGERQPNGQRTTDRSRRSEGRVPPHNLQAEESVLGALLLSREAIGVVSEQGLNPADFYRPAHQHIFDAIRALYSSGGPVDTVTVADELRRGRAARRGRWLGGDARAAERDARHLERQPLRQDRPGHGDAAPADLRRGRHRRARLQRARRRHQGARRGRDQGVPGRRAAGHRLDSPARPPLVGGDGPPPGDVRSRRHDHRRRHRLHRHRRAAVGTPAELALHRRRPTRDGQVRRVGHADGRRVDGRGGRRRRTDGPRHGTRRSRHAVARRRGPPVAFDRVGVSRRWRQAGVPGTNPFRSRGDDHRVASAADGEGLARPRIDQGR